MRKKKAFSVGKLINYIMLALLALGCVLPLLNMLAVSFSDKNAVSAGLVGIFPIGFNLSSYRYVLEKAALWRAFWVTVKRVVLGVSMNVVLAVVTAYPLSKERKAFSFRTFYVWVLFLTILFNGGLIPWYFLIHFMGMMDTIWALVVPGAVPVFNIVLLINFYRQLPKELEEAALMDGASQIKILTKVFIPTSVPAIATITLFSFIWHWNSWFDGMLLMNNPENMPLQSYIQTILIQANTDLYKYRGWEEYAAMGEKTFKAAQIMVSILPLIIVYPFVQRFLTSGIVMGSVKG